MLVYRVRFNPDGSVRASNLHKVYEISDLVGEDIAKKHVPEVVKARITMLRIARSATDPNETTILDGVGKYYWDDEKQFGEVFRVIVQEGEIV